MKKIRLLPAFITLLAGAITSIALYVAKMETYKMLLILLAVLIVFYVLGVIAMKVIVDIEKQEALKAEEAESKDFIIQKSEEQTEEKATNVEANDAKGK